MFRTLFIIHFILIFIDIHPSIGDRILQFLRFFFTALLHFFFFFYFSPFLSSASILFIVLSFFSFFLLFFRSVRLVFIFEPDSLVSYASSSFCIQFIVVYYLYSHSSFMLYNAIFSLLADTSEMHNRLYCIYMQLDAYVIFYKRIKYTNIQNYTFGFWQRRHKQRKRKKTTRTRNENKPLKSIIYDCSTTYGIVRQPNKHFRTPGWAIWRCGHMQCLSRYHLSPGKTKPRYQFELW